MVAQKQILPSRTSFVGLKKNRKAKAEALQ
jgi:hypothetical protein